MKSCNAMLLTFQLTEFQHFHIDTASQLYGLLFGILMRQHIALQKKLARFIITKLFFGPFVWRDCFTAIITVLHIYIGWLQCIIYLLSAFMNYTWVSVYITCNTVTAPTLFVYDIGNETKRSRSCVMLRAIETQQTNR